MILFAHPPNRRTQLASLPEISILLISDRRMSSLHRRFLNKTGSTDVITFDHGEIFISVETAREHARQFRTSTLCEIQLYWSAKNGRGPAKNSRRGQGGPRGRLSWIA